MALREKARHKKKSFSSRPGSYSGASTEEEIAMHLAQQARRSLEWECSVGKVRKVAAREEAGLLSAAKRICAGESQVPEVSSILFGPEHGFPITNRLALSLNCLSSAREGPPVPRQHLEVHLVVLHETRDIPHSMAWHLSLIHSARPSRRGALFHYHLPPFLSSRLFTHEDRRMYARLR